MGFGLMSVWSSVVVPSATQTFHPFCKLIHGKNICSLFDTIVCLSACWPSFQQPSTSFNLLHGRRHGEAYGGTKRSCFSLYPSPILRLFTHEVCFHFNLSMQLPFNQQISFFPFILSGAVRSSSKYVHTYNTQRAKSSRMLKAQRKCDRTKKFGTDECGWSV